MSGTSSPITFGVELEFNVLKRHLETETPEQAICFFGTELAKRTNLPIAGMCRCRGKNVCTGCRSVPEQDRRVAQLMTLYGNPVHDHSLDKDERPDAPFEYFFILNEPCVPSDRSDLVGMEITTPIHKADQITAKLPQIHQLIQTLSHMRSGIEICDLTGLHVHIGSQDKLTLRTAQKCTTLVSILELPLLRAIQPRSRRESIWGHADPILTDSLIVESPAGLGQIWQMAAMYKRERAQVDAHVPLEARQRNAYWQKNGKQIEKLLHGVWTATSFPELSRGLSRNGHERLGMALSLRGAAPNENKESTIEFRYCAMTFDVPYITMWVSVVSRIVELSHFEVADFAAKVRDILQALGNWIERHPETCFADLLKAMGFSAVQVQEWLPLIQQHRNGHDRSIDQANRLIPHATYSVPFALRPS